MIYLMKFLRREFGVLQIGIKATVKHINAIIIWYHMHDVETLGVAYSRVICDIQEMMIETLICDVMLF